MSRIVTLDRFGAPEVLRIENRPTPMPEPGQVRVAVQTAAFNRVDALYRSGAVRDRLPLRPPSGIGLDFAGIVDAVGPGADERLMGAHVLGSVPFRAMAEHVIVRQDAVSLKPDELSWEHAASVPTAGTTGWNAARALQLDDTDTVLVSAAAGGVGLIAAQIARRTGATVIGTASIANHDLLRSIGVIPIEYGPDLAERLRAVNAPLLTAALENHGSEAIQAAIALSVPRERINSVTGNDTQFGVSGVGGAATPDAMNAVARLLTTGTLVLPIQQVFDVGDIVEAHRLLDTGHLAGKLIVRFAS